MSSTDKLKLNHFSEIKIEYTLEVKWLDLILEETVIYFLYEKVKADFKDLTV